MSIGEFTFRVGRRIGKHPLAGRLFCLVEPLLPVRRIARRDGLVAFHHSRPIADPHILVVPTRPFASLVSHGIDQKMLTGTLWSMVQLARSIAGERAPDGSWQMVINGGTRQDIGQMHGHLMVTDSDVMAVAIDVSDPDQDEESWTAIFSELAQADAIADNGYSLEFRWNMGSVLRARVTQSAANV